MKTIPTIIAASLAALLVGCSTTPQATSLAPASLPVITVSQGNAETQNEYPATIEGESEVEIRPQVGGILEKVFVDEGTFVQKGQPLFQIDDQVYRQQVNNATAELGAAQAAAENAQIEVNKVQPLVENKVVVDLQLKTASANLNAARSKVAQAKAILADAKIKLGYTLIKAPVSGYIGRLNKKVGSLLAVTDADELTDLSNIKDVRVYFSLSEAEFSDLKSRLPGNTIAEKLKSAASVKLRLSDGQDYAVNGKLDMVNGKFDKNSGAISVRATFANTDGLLRSGNTGRIILTFKEGNVIAIPQSATTMIQDRRFVYVVGDSSKVRKQVVTISGSSANNFYIKEGLKSGDRIVLEGVEGLQDGAKIQPVSSKDNTVAYNR
ncbi:efflux RND transporter periplasmic adaptor subunit [Mucilaginibacter sp. cycad4]|uniref:efflux RND transporter periplasmic adaptor subunit n=1 Tax=Mucilaginibacter sp. cycad4 TaxID=3342096 RepID=UPI002AAAB114|nr:efflux RND transporter periplasmic adaptor subunit [Mucilaginibacter gossypii]WPU99170.1 efflux RND transporter periplasmic adaptor subunit [Mucilaginibacter gossypii]